jgi:SAM-dependent methyltransferase
MPRPPCVLACLALAACAAPPRAPAPSATAPRITAAEVVARLGREAEAMRPLVGSRGARRFLDAAARLPAMGARTVYLDAGHERAYTAAEAAALPEVERRALERRDLDAEYYYFTRYGTPVAYARPLDLLGREGFAGARVLDFGYGGVGQLRMLASLGADVTGVDVDPIQPALYGEAGDQGEVAAAGGAGAAGRLRLVAGRFPADAQVARAVGEGYDLIVSKNVLKRGYIHPSRPADPRLLIRLGVDDAGFVAALHRALAPGGRVLLYNVTPAESPPDKPYLPWADGRSPFAREVLEAAGFRVLTFDRDDTEAARAMARALGWDRDRDEPMDVDHDLFATYTMLEKPAAPSP